MIEKIIGAIVQVTDLVKVGQTIVSMLPVKKHNVLYETTLEQLLQQQVGDFALANVQELGAATDTSKISAFYRGTDGSYVHLLLWTCSSAKMARLMVRELTHIYVHEDGSHRKVDDFEIIAKEQEVNIGSGVVLEGSEDGTTQDGKVIWSNYWLIAQVQGPPRQAGTFFASSEY